MTVKKNVSSSDEVKKVETKKVEGKGTETMATAKKATTKQTAAKSTNTKATTKKPTVSNPLLEKPEQLIIPGPKGVSNKQMIPVLKEKYMDKEFMLKLMNMHRQAFKGSLKYMSNEIKAVLVPLYNEHNLYDQIVMDQKILDNLKAKQELENEVIDLVNAKNKQALAEFLASVKGKDHKDMILKALELM